MNKRLLKIFLFFLLFIICDRGISFILTIGLNKYFGLNQHSKILLIGHSELMLATDHSRIENELNCFVSKYCKEGATIEDRLQMVKQYIESPYSDSLQVVVLGVDSYMFKGEGLSKNSYTTLYPYIDNPLIRRYIKEHTSTPEFIKHYLIHSQRFSDALINSSIRGWLNNRSNYKFGILDTTVLNRQILSNQQRTIEFDKEQMLIFEQIVQYIASKKIHLILLRTPIIEQLNNCEPQKHNKLDAYFHSIADNSKYIEYWDINKDISSHHEYFFDSIHLNRDGQQIATQKIIQLFYNNKQILL